MKDIVDISGTDIVLFNSSVSKAKNVLEIQLGNLKYATTFGCDMNYFLDDRFEFTNESFRSYRIQRLAESGVDVLSVVDVLDTFSSDETFNLAIASEDASLIR